MQLEMQSSHKGMPLGEEERHSLLADLEQAEVFLLFNPFCPEAPLLYYEFWPVPVG